jgi:hypothetical protein
MTKILMSYDKIVYQTLVYLTLGPLMRVGAQIQPHLKKDLLLVVLASLFSMEKTSQNRNA